MTNDELDDLVELWHESNYPEALSVFIMNATGWTKDQYELWAMSGINPDDEED